MSFRLRNVDKFLISSEQFQEYLDRHKNQACMVPESNEAMQTSYLMLDEEMRFLDCSSGSKIPSKSILEVGVEMASKDAGFDYQKFTERNGIYDWTRSNNCDSGCNNSNLDW